MHKSWKYGAMTTSADIKRKFGEQNALRSAQFKRGVSVAYKTNPDVIIGTVFTPPGRHNANAIITLESGKRKTINVTKLVVAKDT